ncbi:hypothetical protein [Erythrobacter sp. F6033]|uniref:hypothetical protein n=1 Tax=Erythrobacter sp. F6033 TaxID=2926401 RepID=UPI001FF11BE2|nr:hypothetical protein [Erythrobacter sp. F6033]MCK0129488.1 hypothetical protein [Erythrobacter sp. F6033]
MKFVQGLAGLTLGMVGGLLVIFFVLGGPPATEALQAEAPSPQASVEKVDSDAAAANENGAHVRVSLKG